MACLKRTATLYVTLVTTPNRLPRWPRWRLSLLGTSEGIATAFFTHHQSLRRSGDRCSEAGGESSPDAVHVHLSAANSVTCAA